ncbi:sigma-70 family RNA polymerase sigma factor [Marivirga sp. S37H4]|uniref:Sigma-70 family RNA polymerase sigma factor n=1 Tax=Marivirga aurantiaca TaxID=2802615 RepID=A0A935C4S2_9BACT|nr:sigma-70 family RNA polymerase sigma factor [Marivirga aurantiaca]MBK6263425.1 sigma-70 family RNA polymerase sigma factor [Marivirga aurantiaca]
MTEGERESIFKEWVAQYKALLFKVVRAYAFNTEDQDDLFQEIAIQVWQSIPSFKQEAKVSTWLYKVSLNTALRWVKKTNKYQSNLDSIDDEMPIIDKSEHADERLDWIYEKISRMDKVDRSLTLLLLDGFGYKEMSEILGIKASNVGVKIHRIKNQLIKESKNYASHGI